MKFLVDANLPCDIVTTAAERDHQAVWVRDVLPGAPDADILARLQRLRKAWLRFLFAPREPQSIAVVTAEKTRYRRYPR